MQQQSQVAGHHLVGREQDGFFDEMGVDEEVFDPRLGKRLFDAHPREGRPGVLFAVGGDGGLPKAGRPVAALGNPHAAGLGAKVALMDGDRRADLRGDTLIGAEQRQVAVGGRAGEDLDGPGFAKVPEGLHNVAVEFVEIRQRLFEKLQPEDSSLGETVLAILAEIVLVLAGRDDLALDVFGKLIFERGVRKLLEQNRGEAQVGLEPKTVPSPAAASLAAAGDRSRRAASCSHSSP